MAANKKAVRDRRRKAAIDELLSTEKTYVHLMENLVTHFVIELRENTSIISKDDYKILFPSDIHAILGLNRTFLEDLTKIIESDTFNILKTKIGDIIFSFCPHFKMYQNYLNNYSGAATRLSELRSKSSSSSFSAYCQGQRAQAYFNNLPLESLIVLPIQRMPRYKMLLEEIIKHTDATHPDLSQLKNALTQISQVNDGINTRMKEDDSRRKVQEIENRFHGKISDLVTPSRRYIRQGQLCKIETKDDQDFLFILFSDCLLYASQSMIGDKLIFANLLPFNDKFKVAVTGKKINVHHIENLFQIHSTAESFMLYAATLKDMQEWIGVVTKTCHDYVSLATTVKNEELSATKNVYAATLQIPNDFAEKCMNGTGCATKFSFVSRKHHCKYCGFVVCSKCSSNQLQSRPTAADAGTTMVRVCDVCYAKHAGVKKDASSPALAHQPTPKALDILGYARPPTASRRKTLKTFGRVRENELLKMYEKRAKKAEAEEKKEAVRSSGGRNVPPPPPKKKQAAAAVLDFVKLDIEPKLIALETDKKKLEEKAAGLQAENDSLKSERYAEKQATDKMAKQNDELVHDNERLQSLLDKLSSTTDQKKKAEEIQNAKIKTLQSHNDNLQTELKLKEEEIARLLHYKQNYDRLESKLREKDEQFGELLSKFGKLQEINKEIDEMTQLADVSKSASSSPSKAAAVPPTVASMASLTVSHAESEKKLEVDASQSQSQRVCQTCNKKIVGRALRTKGGLHHRACHVCKDCNVSLAGKKYGITQANGKKIKLCEQCTNKINETRLLQTRQRHKSKSSLMDQMNQFRSSATRVPKPWETNLNKKSVNNTLKPSIAASMAANHKGNSNENVPKARMKKSRSVSKMDTAFLGGYGAKKSSRKSASLMTQKKCSKCKVAIFGKNKVEGANGAVFHPNCFRCFDCDNELPAKNWRSYPSQSKKGGNNILTLCPNCVQKRDEALFSQYRGKLKLNI